MNKKFICIFFCFVQLVLLRAADEKQIRFQHYFTEDGLSNNTINCIIQDRKGFIWFGTYGGINRYDGYRFKSYSVTKDSNSICSNKIVTLCEDREGNIWIGSNDNGVSRFNPATGEFTNYNNESSAENALIHNSVSKIFCDGKGFIWIATTGGGVSLFKPETNDFLNFLPNNDEYSIPTRHVTALTEDSEGNLWLAHDRNIISRLDSNFHLTVFEAINNGEPMFTSYYKELMVYNDILWVGTEDNGLFIFDLKNEEFKIPDDEPAIRDLGETTIKSMQVDNNKRMWIANDGQGLTIFNLKDHSILKYHFDFCIDETLSSNALLSLLIDKDENVWIGANQAGINLYRNNSERFSIIKHGIDDGLKQPSVLGITQDSNQNIWLGTDGGGLTRWNQQSGKYTHFLHDDNGNGSISGNNIVTVYIDSRNNLWAGTFSKGLNRLKKDGQSFDVFMADEHDPNSISHNNVWAIYEDTYHNLWIGTLGGGLNLFDYKSENFTGFFPDMSNPTSIIHEQISVIFEDSRDNLWIGTYGGLEIMDRETKEFKHFVASDKPGSIPDNIINCIYEDSKNRLWIGNDGGLSQYDYEKGTFNTIVFNRGLLKNSVQSIQEDTSGYLWLGTRQGLIRYSPGNGRILVYDKISGLPGSEFNGNSSFYDNRENRMYFGSTQGLCSFLPDEFKADSGYPQIALTNFKIQNQEIEPGKEYRNRIVLPKSITYSSSVHLDYKDNVFTIEFAALEYSTPSKIMYRFKLEGFDENWITTDATRRSATYTNLPGGNYKFLLSSTNANGDWNPDPIALNIEIDPPFWKTIWFRILVLFTVFILIYLVYRSEREQYRHKMKERTLNNEKELVRQRNEELRSEIASSTMLLAQKNEMLQKVVQNIQEIKETEPNKKLDDTLKLLSSEIDRDNYWEQFQFNFDRVYMNLLSRLKETYPELTRSNLKLCAYLRLNLSSKEIASLLNITLSGVDKSRNRLRKRIGLEPHEDLYDFLINF